MTDAPCQACGGPVNRAASAHGGRPRSYCHRCRPPQSHRSPVLAVLACDAPPLLRAAVSRAQELSEARGWTTATVDIIVRTLTRVLTDHPGGEPVALSTVRNRSGRNGSVTRTAEVLADLGVLDDDTTPSIRIWIDRRSRELPAAFAEDIRDWLTWLLDGDARTRPRAVSSIYVYLGSVRPFIHQWAATRHHLREVTLADVTGSLDQLRGHRRRNALTALKCLFKFAKRRGLVFADPVRRLSVGQDIPRTALPMTDDQVRDVELITDTAAQRFVVALAAVHAVRAKTIRELTLDDVDLANNRITLTGHTQRLGEAARRALLVWLEQRRASWPFTANRHVLVSRVTALGTEPVSHYYLKKHLLLRGVHLEQIRGDRVLQEALRTGADPLHLAIVFDLHATTAIGYADIARRILEAPRHATE